jgi:hypothetical protein
VVITNVERACASAALVNDLNPQQGAFCIWNLMPRGEFFAALFIVGCVNGLVPEIISSIHQFGWKDALIDSFGISAIIWVACFAGIFLIIRERTERLRRLDFVLGAGFLLLTFLPAGKTSWLAITVLSIYLLLGGGVDSPRWRGAAILLATTVPMFWSRMLFACFSNLILDIDASLGAWLLGTGRVGNMIRFADNTGYLIIFPACSSLANTSLAFLCWIALSQAVGHRWSYRDLPWCFLACASVVIVNVIRISLMGRSQQSYEVIHGEWGRMVVSAIILCLTIGISALGVRRELFARV